MQFKPLTGKEVPSLNARAVCKREAYSNGKGCSLEPKAAWLIKRRGKSFGTELKGTQQLTLLCFEKE